MSYNSYSAFGAITSASAKLLLGASSCREGLSLTTESLETAWACDFIAFQTLHHLHFPVSPYVFQLTDYGCKQIKVLEILLWETKLIIPGFHLKGFKQIVLIFR